MKLIHKAYILSASFLAIWLTLPINAAASAFGADTLATDFAENPERPDTVLAEVVVTGTRNLVNARSLPMVVTVIDRETIEKERTPSLLPTLSAQVPGLFVTSRGIMGYGVSGGSAGDISIRGISGSSARTMVLIDGHPQYMGIMGHPVADVYQSMLAERVEVLRTPSSVIYGSNAMGGVVNILTRKMETDGMSTDIHAAGGSFNTIETEAANRFRKGRFSSVVNASFNRTDGHRNDLDFMQYSSSARLGYDFSTNWKAGASAIFTHFEASTPGSIYAPLEDARQRISRGLASVYISNDYGFTSGEVSMYCSFGHHWINDGHAPDADPRMFRYISDDSMTGGSMFQSARLFNGNRTTVGIDWAHLSGYAWNRFLDGSKTVIADKSQDRLAAYLDFRQAILPWMALDAGLRADHDFSVGTAWVPQGGVSFSIPSAITLKALASRGFRFPTIREMYMFPPQNPDLKPESLWTYEIAFSQSFAELGMQYGVNVFYIDGKDMIVTVPRAGATPLNMNTGKIRNAGVEATWSYRINDVWSFNANYSYLHMKNPVLAAPRNKAYAGGSFSKGRFDVVAGLQYVEGLYTSLKPENQEDFLLLNMSASFRILDWLSLRARGENLLAQEYCINDGYPMPRATIIAGLDLRF